MNRPFVSGRLRDAVLLCFSPSRLHASCVLLHVPAGPGAQVCGLGAHRPLSGTSTCLVCGVVSRRGAVRAPARVHVTGSGGLENSSLARKRAQARHGHEHRHEHSQRLLVCGAAVNRKFSQKHTPNHMHPAYCRHEQPTCIISCCVQLHKKSRRG